jgi:hypothetical protein
MTTEQRQQIIEIINIKKIKDMITEMQKLKETVNWYEDYSKVVYQNKPNIDQYACDYADEQQELRNK